MIDKPGKGAFFATDLHAILQSRGIEQLFVTGVTTEVCVNTTVREANDRGYECLVPEDCVAPIFRSSSHGTEDDQGAGGIFGWVVALRRAFWLRSPHSTPPFMTGDDNDDIKPKLWVPGDWSAFFGFGTNILVNLLTLTALLRFVLKMPDDIVFGRILPATGLMLCL